jgi:hypothetical protein
VLDWCHAGIYTATGIVVTEEGVGPLTSTCMGLPFDGAADNFEYGFLI